MKDNKIMQSMWVGSKLTVMERLSIASYLYHGHEFHLYTYRLCDGVPAGVIIKDANEIMLEEEIENYPSLPIFSDVFRLKLLQRNGGWWTDLDSVCLKPFDFNDDYVFCSEEWPYDSGQSLTEAGVLKVPKNSEFIALALARCQKQDPSRPKGEILNGILAFGGELIHNLTAELNLRQYVPPTYTFVPIPCNRIPYDLIDPSLQVNLSRSYAVHLFRSQWHKVGGTEVKFPTGCLYEQLKRRYLGQGVVQGLWVGGRLSTLEQLSITSYLANGHEFHLYTYGNVAGIPAGTLVKDANEIVPKSDIERFKNLANFSDWFRYHLLLKKGNWWVDMDTVCLRPFDFPEDHVFVEQRDNKIVSDYINGDFIKAPVGSFVMAWCIKQCERKNWKTMEWCEIGPHLITKAVKHFALHPHPFKEFFSPSHMPNDDKEAFFNGKTQVPDEVYGVHFWRSGWQVDRDTLYCETSIYEQLKQKYIPVPKKNILIAVVTCKKNIARAKALRETWVPLARAAGYDVEFFDGKCLGVPDDYVNLPLKAKGIFEWAWKHQFNRVLKVDDDTYIKIDMLKPCAADYAGFFCNANDYGKMIYGIPDFPAGTFPHDYITGGAVWFSNKVVKLLVETPLNDDFADDRWVGHVLAEAGIKFTVLPEFCFYPPKILSETSLVINVPSPEAIYDLHNGVIKQPQLIQPVVSQEDWKKTFLGKKVDRLVGMGFNVAICNPGSLMLDSLRKRFPAGIEENIETPLGKRVLFCLKAGTSMGKILQSQL